MGNGPQSLRAIPYHNVDLDEAHKRLKYLTSLPSEHLTVSLANFMSYIDKFIYLLINAVFLFSKKLAPKHRNAMEYVNIVLKVISSKFLFCQDLDCSLENVMVT